MGEWPYRAQRPTLDSKSDRGGGSRITDAMSRMTWPFMAFYTSGYAETPLIVGLFNGVS